MKNYFIINSKKKLSNSGLKAKHELITNNKKYMYYHRYKNLSDYVLNKIILKFFTQIFFNLKNKKKIKKLFVSFFLLYKNFYIYFKNNKNFLNKKYFSTKPCFISVIPYFQKNYLSDKKSLYHSCLKRKRWKKNLLFKKFFLKKKNYRDKNLLIFNLVSTQRRVFRQDANIVPKKLAHLALKFKRLQKLKIKGLKYKLKNRFYWFIRNNYYYSFFKKKYFLKDRFKFLSNRKVFKKIFFKKTAVKRIKTRKINKLIYLFKSKKNIHKINNLKKIKYKKFFYKYFIKKFSILYFLKKYKKIQNFFKNKIKYIFKKAQNLRLKIIKKKKDLKKKTLLKQIKKYKNLKKIIIFLKKKIKYYNLLKDLKKYKFLFSFKKSLKQGNYTVNITYFHFLDILLKKKKGTFNKFIILDYMLKYSNKLASNSKKKYFLKRFWKKKNIKKRIKNIWYYHENKHKIKHCIQFLNYFKIFKNFKKMILSFYTFNYLNFNFIVSKFKKNNNFKLYFLKNIFFKKYILYKNVIFGNINFFNSIKKKIIIKNNNNLLKIFRMLIIIFILKFLKGAKFNKILIFKNAMLFKKLKLLNLNFLSLIFLHSGNFYFKYNIKNISMNKNVIKFLSLLAY